MSAVLLSIKPKYCELIASGKKTIEVRKTRPKIDTPFKCYIYETQQKVLIGEHFEPSRSKKNFLCGGKMEYIIKRDYYYGKGKVIGEFVCDRIDKVYQCNSGWGQEFGCISRKDFFDYLGLPYNSHFDDKGAFAWHITDLKIYGKPKELSGFYSYVLDYTIKHGSNYSRVLSNPLKRPPQSWQFVEELGE